MHSNLEEFAEHVRRECNRIMGAVLAGNTQRAGQLAAALCTLSADIVQQKRMQAELSDPDRYDLAALPAPKPVADESTSE